MRWCRRGHIFVVGVIILVLVLLEWKWGISYSTEDGPPTQAHQTEASVFLSKKNAWILRPNKVLMECDNANNNVELLVIVTSAVGHHDARDAVRKSWSPNMPSSWLLVFFLGATKDSDQQEEVKEEATKHEDVIQDSRFLDTYYNLTLKTLALMQWTQKYCTNAKFLLKIDDDMYLNIPKLHRLTACISEARGNMYSDRRYSSEKYLNGNSKEATRNNISDICAKIKPYEQIHYYINADNHEYESYFFGGYLYEGVKADRNQKSKWYLDSRFYPATFLPPFLSGTAYILSTNLIQHLLYGAKHQPIIHLEDVYITGLVGSHGLKLKLSHLEGWSRFRPQWNSVCLYKELLTVHGLSPSELLAMTSSVHALNYGECDTFMVYFSNFLNSLVSSLFPRIT